MMARIDHVRFSLKLRRPVQCGDVRVPRRDGVLIALHSDHNAVGYGEATPLPGLHSEDITDIRGALPIVSQAFARTRVEHLSDLRNVLRATPARTMPSLYFAIEMAWLSHAARANRTGIADILTSTPTPNVAICALFEGSSREADTAIREGEFTHHTTIKVKVGRRPVEEERATLQALLHTDNTTRLRLDGNRRLSLDSAAQLVEGFDPRCFEFFEEPLTAAASTPATLSELADRTGIRIALDETLRFQGVDAFQDADSIAAWIVKPALHTGIAATLELASRAASLGIACVVSSCFESGLGLWALAHLAAALPPVTAGPIAAGHLAAGHLAAGLGTGRWLAEDIITPPFASQHGTVELSDWCSAPNSTTLDSLSIQGIDA